MEMFVRLALTKNVKSGVCDSAKSGVIKLFEENVLPLFNKYDSHEFRKEKLWNEECDLMFKKYWKVILELFKRYSGKMAIPGTPKYVSLDEFIEMITNSGVVDEDFGAREIGVLYNLGMMTQKNELDLDRHFAM